MAGGSSRRAAKEGDNQEIGRYRQKGRYHQKAGIGKVAGCQQEAGCHTKKAGHLKPERRCQPLAILEKGFNARGGKLAANTAGADDGAVP